MEKNGYQEKIRTAHGERYEVPIEGSLNLLALGYKGLSAWRDKKQLANYQMNNHLIIPSKKED